MNDPEIRSVPEANPQEATNSPQRREDAENAAHEQSNYMAVEQAACRGLGGKEGDTRAGGAAKLGDYSRWDLGYEGS